MAPEQVSKRPRDPDTASVSSVTVEHKKIRSGENAGEDEQVMKSRFRPDLFQPEVLELMADEYAKSSPYKHCVISDLIAPDLLRQVRKEILDNVSFTPKETDIYKIHQSGDLANLDGLDQPALALLPSLLKLRDALYSATFRSHIAAISGSGPLSGIKRDLAINVYTPGCHLLCHDDVIGTRRVSYILYLTDPDNAWQAGWGGALRLYPTTLHTRADGRAVRVPDPDFARAIPPAFNQLSFFAVQPGESFHDVEEVYFAPPGSAEAEADGKRIRMAVSGWFHIPQEGEDGYVPGLEERLAEDSSLNQLQSNADEFDRPQPEWHELVPAATSTEAAGSEEGAKAGVRKEEAEAEAENDDEQSFTETDLEYLLQFIDAKYLIPETVAVLHENFRQDCSLRLGRFLSASFQERLRSWIAAADGAPADAAWQEKHGYAVAAPPHKHRFLFRSGAAATAAITAAATAPSAKGKEPTTAAAAAGPASGGGSSPVDELLAGLFPSVPFRKWVALVTGARRLLRMNVGARRFRRGSDYALATAYEREEPRLELSLALSPWHGWDLGADEEEDEEEGKGEGEAGAGPSTKRAAPAEAGKEAEVPALTPEAAAAEGELGGYEAYMAGEDDGGADSGDDGEGGDAAGSKGGAKPDESTGAGNRPSGRKQQQQQQPPQSKKGAVDPAVYKAAGDDEDDGILLSVPASWNEMSIVLRDRGTLRFVKYVSAHAGGDRWDVTAEIEIEEEEDDDDDDDDDEDEDDDDMEDGDDDDDDEDEDDEEMEDEE